MQTGTTRTPTGYAHPDALVSTAWMEDHLDTSTVRVVEVDIDTTLYGQGHVPGAGAMSWRRELQDSIRRDIIARDAFERLMGALGITSTDTVVVYGDHHNWFAAWAFWLLRLYGHPDVRVMDGGRALWLAEERPLSLAVPRPRPTAYQAVAPQPEVRALRADVERALRGADHAGTGVRLVDVRTPREFSGEQLHNPDFPQEQALRGGHIPDAVNIPWELCVRPDGTFRSAAELRALYGAAGVTPDRPVITYCNIGERSSHSWFVLSQLLGYPAVRNYDGSWAEWGNAIGLPIAR